MQRPFYFKILKREREKVKNFFFLKFFFVFHFCSFFLLKKRERYTHDDDTRDDDVNTNINDECDETEDTGNENERFCAVVVVAEKKKK